MSTRTTLRHSRSPLRHSRVGGNLTLRHSHIHTPNHIIQPLHHRRRHSLHRKRTTHPYLGTIHPRLVVQRYRSILGVARKHTRRNIRHGLVPKPAPNSPIRIRQLVIVIYRRHQPLPRQGQRHTRRIARYPPTTPLLRNICSRPRPTRRIQHQIPRIRRHQYATLDSLGRRFHDIPLGARMHLRRPHIVDPPTRHLVLVLLPPQRALAFQCLQPSEFRQQIQSLIGNRPMAIRAAQKDPATVLIWFGAPSGRDALGIQSRAPIDSRSFREMGLGVKSFLIGRFAEAAVRQLYHYV